MFRRLSLADRWRRPMRRPSGCRLKTLGRETSPHPIAGAIAAKWPKWQGLAMATKLKTMPAPDALGRLSRAGWLYFDAEFFEAEKAAFLRAAPQVVCHESEIAAPGEWRTLEYLGESVIVIRGDD